MDGGSSATHMWEWRLPLGSCSLSLLLLVLAWLVQMGEPLHCHGAGPHWILTAVGTSGH